MSFKTEINDHIYYQFTKYWDDIIWNESIRSISFFAKLWIIPTGGDRENTNNKTRTMHAFSIFNQKNENKDKDKL